MINDNNVDKIFYSGIVKVDDSDVANGDDDRNYDFTNTNAPYQDIMKLYRNDDDKEVEQDDIFKVFEQKYGIEYECLSVYSYELSYRSKKVSNK
eukprot:Pgem_evm1s13358